MLPMCVRLFRRTTGAVAQDEAVTSLYATVPLGCRAVAVVCHVCRLIGLLGTHG